MDWADALGIGLGSLSIPLNVVVFYLIQGAIARRWCMIILIFGSAFGGEFNDNCHGGVVGHAAQRTRLPEVA